MALQNLINISSIGLYYNLSSGFENKIWGWTEKFILRICINFTNVFPKYVVTLHHNTDLLKTSESYLDEQKQSSPQRKTRQRNYEPEIKRESMGSLTMMY
jgi:hypothetical protein